MMTMMTPVVPARVSIAVSVQTAVDALFDAVSPIIQTISSTEQPFVPSAVGASVQSVVDAIAPAVEAIFVVIARRIPPGRVHGLLLGDFVVRGMG
jgi:hypothetical protein